MKNITEHITATAGHDVPAEIEYKYKNNKVIGFWAYGYWHPNLPYKGDRITTVNILFWYIEDIFTVNIKKGIKKYDSMIERLKKYLMQIWVNL